MFKAKIKSKNVAEALDSVNVLVEECKIHLKEDELAIRAVDPANVGMVDLSLGKDSFETLEANGGIIGVNLNKLREATGMANSGDVIHLSLDEETRKLHIDVDGLSYTMSLIDPDSIREEPDIPDLDLPVQAIVEGQMISNGIKAADMVSDHCALKFNQEDDSLHIEAKGDTDDADYKIKEDDMISHTPGKGKSLFSLDYLKDINKAIPKNAEVTIELGEEFPTKLHFTPVEADIKVTYMIAPRIKSE